MCYYGTWYMVYIYGSLFLADETCKHLKQVSGNIFPLLFGPWVWSPCEVSIIIIIQNSTTLYSLQSFSLQIVLVNSHSDPMRSVKLTIFACWPKNLLELIG